MNDFVWRAVGPLQLLVNLPLEEAGFTNAFSTRLGGVSSLPDAALSLGNFRQDSRANVLENRRRFQAALNAEAWTLVTANQIHSADVRSVRDEQDAQAAATECDALTANVPRTLLGVQTADCQPVLLVDPRTRAFAAIHAGWRGTVQRIVSRTIERMQTDYGTAPSDLLAAFGPAIGPCCFEVGPEVIEQFTQSFSFGAAAFSGHQANGKAQLNLSLVNRALLGEMGLPDANIFDCGYCTVCRPDLFFSYRREHGATQPIGRLMAVIGREN